MHVAKYWRNKALYYRMIGMQTQNQTAVTVDSDAIAEHDHMRLRKYNSNGETKDGKV